MSATNTRGKTREGSKSVGSQRLSNCQAAVIIITTLMVGVGICAMIVASTSTIRAELRTEIRRVDANLLDMRRELSAEINRLRHELSADIQEMRPAR